jgi:hypothetical protein
MNAISPPNLPEGIIAIDSSPPPGNADGGEVSVLQVQVTDGSVIIQRMLELLSQEDDELCRDWVACIVTELVEHTIQLLPLAQPKAVLLYGMQLPNMSKDIPNYLEVSYFLKA